ncbi:MAG: tetratricopeptide repeat protein [Crocinitomicaceae bacterium]|nr:tetratricopeptide repeat protein [Crocinitomicaceae bacterium]
MSKLLRPFKFYVLVTLLFSMHFSVNAQDVEALKQLTIDYFEPQATVEINYNSFDFDPVPAPAKPIDPLTTERLIELKDSLKITGDKKYLMALGNLYFRMNHKPEAQGYFKRAIEAYNTALAASPNDLDLLNDLFTIYYAIGDTENALKYNTEILRVDPKDTTAMTVRGFIYVAQGDYKRVIDYANAIIEQHPDFDIQYFLKTIGHTFTDIIKMQSEFDENGELIWRSLNIDLSYLEEVREQYPDDARIQLMAICSEFFVFYYDAMIPVMKMGTVKTEGFEFPLTRDQLGALKKFEKRFIAFLDDPNFKNYYTVNYSLGLIELLRGKNMAAIDYFEIAIKNKSTEYRGLLSNVVSAYDNLIAAYMFMGDRGNAERWQLAKINDRASVDPMAKDLVKFADFNLFRNDLEQGEKFLLKSLEIDPSNIDAYAYLARVEMLKGDLIKAEEYINLLYELDENNIELYKSLVLMSLFKDDKETAMFLNDLLLGNDPLDNFANDVKEKILTDE